jgi:hypothetical protein
LTFFCHPSHFPPNVKTGSSIGLFHIGDERCAVAYMESRDACERIRTCVTSPAWQLRRFHVTSTTRNFHLTNFAQHTSRAAITVHDVRGRKRIALRCDHRRRRSVFKSILRVQRVLTACYPGLTGIVAAQRLLQAHPDTHITILERDYCVGGVWSQSTTTGVFVSKFGDI